MEQAVSNKAECWYSKPGFGCPEVSGVSFLLGVCGWLVLLGFCWFVFSSNLFSLY